MIIEINYVGNEANEEPQKLDDIKIMAIDTQTKQLIDDLKDEVADLDSRLDAVEEGGGGAIELPTVTADDDGSVLGVVDGQWDKMEQGTAGDILFDIGVADGVLDKTWTEIHTAVASGKIVRILDSDEYFANSAYVVKAFTDDEFYFVYLAGDNGWFQASTANGYPEFID